MKFNTEEYLLQQIAVIEVEFKKYQENVISNFKDNINDIPSGYNVISRIEIVKGTFQDKFIKAKKKIQLN